MRFTTYPKVFHNRRQRAAYVPKGCWLLVGRCFFAGIGLRFAPALVMLAHILIDGCGVTYL